MCPQSSEGEVHPLEEKIFNLLLSHRDKLKIFSGSFILKVNSKEGRPFHFFISPTSIEKAPTEVNLPEVWVDYETLVKVLENPSKALMYYFLGKIKIKGDPRAILKL